MKNQKGYTLFELVFTLVAIGTLLWGIAMLYIGIHFLIKFW